MVSLPTLNEASSALEEAAAFKLAFCKLAREHGLEKYVGLALVHQHENCDQGTILIETPDGPNTFRLQALPQDSALVDAVPSVWRVQGQDLVVMQGCGCHSPPN